MDSISLNRASHFNPRSSCEERQQGYITYRAGVWKVFQSTLLMRGATLDHDHVVRVTGISIHAPHARSDFGYQACHFLRIDFNPRSSCEERQIYITLADDTLVFQSTLLMRGATHAGRNRLPDGCISIHAPHARSDPSTTACDGCRASNFNPRSSCEERR